MRAVDESTSLMNRGLKRAAVIVLNNAHLHFSPKGEAARCREAHTRNTFSHGHNYAPFERGAA